MAGGGQRSLLLILERLNKKRFKPFLICPSEGDLINKAQKLGVETTVMKIGRLKRLNIFSVASAIFSLRRFIKNKNIDLIHTDAPHHTFYAGMAARLRGKPLIWHVRVSDPEKRLYDKFLSMLASRVIPVSKAVGKRFEGISHRSDKFVVIYNGVDVKEFGPQQADKRFKEEFEIEDDSILVGTLGQLIPSKGQKLFLKAAAEVLKLFPGIKFVIVGDGNETYRNRLEDLSRELGINEKVIFTGFREDIPRIMASLDIIAFPTHHFEGFSRVVLEGMASSKPVITTAIGGNPEAIEDGKNGILVPVGDLKGLARAILELAMDETKRAQIGEAGRRRAEKLFSIEQNIAQIEKLYEEMLCRDM